MSLLFISVSNQIWDTLTPTTHSSTIDRQRVLTVMAELTPELNGIFYQRYNTPYMLLHADGTRDMFENGMAQGCTLSTAALGAIQKHAEPRIIEECKAIKNDWKLDVSGKYHDDATDVADVEDLEIFYNTSCKIYREYGTGYITLKFIT